MADKMEGVVSAADADAEQPQVETAESVEQKTVAGTLSAIAFPTWLPSNAYALLAHPLPVTAECAKTL